MSRKFIILSMIFCIYQCSAVVNNSTNFYRLKKSEPRCGVPHKLDGLIIGGAMFNQNKYPWMTALMSVIDESKTLKYFCGGTLVSTRKVLTAAHCIYNKNDRRKLPREISILLGVHDLKYNFEPGRFVTTPRSIYIHPDWNPQSKIFDADISAIILEDEMIMYQSCQFVCGITKKKPTEIVGTVIGYGKSEDDTKIHETIPKELEIPILSFDKCYAQAPVLANFASANSFCAGAADGTGPCVGDSGHGLFFKHNGVFFLRGIVSSSIIDDKRVCDVTKFALFTDVLKYKNWILNPSDYYESPMKIYTTEGTTSTSTSSTTTTTKTLTTRKRYSYENNYNQLNYQKPAPTLYHPFQNAESSCGIMSSSAGLIHGGELSARNQFPWEAIISLEYKGYYGSGCLISLKHVLTNSASVSYLDNENNWIPSFVNGVQIFLGTTKYDDLSQPGSLKLGVTKIVNHPKAKRPLPGLDIFKVSIVTLELEVFFTEYIRPVCIWPFDANLNQIIGRDAYAVGYGHDQNGRNSLTRKHVKVTVKDRNYCEKYYQKEIAAANGTVQFCVIENGKEGPCITDDQLYMKVSTKWYVKGILSTLKLFSSGACNVNKPTFVKDIASYVPWIQSQINKNSMHFAQIVPR